MKYFRMDSDLPDWDVWHELYDVLGKHDFHAGVACYLFMYAEYCKKLNEENRKTAKINIRKLAGDLHISRKKVCRVLMGIIDVFGIEVVSTESATKVRPKSDQSPTKVRPASDKEQSLVTLCPTSVELFYPNLVKKQRLPSRDGNGKFQNCRPRQENTRQDKENIKNSGTKIPGCENPVDNHPPPIDQTRPPETIFADHPDSVAFDSPDKKLEPDKSEPPEKPPPAKKPDAVKDQSDFDTKTAENLYHFIFGLNRKFNHADKIGDAKPETWGQHIKRLRIDDSVSERDIRAVLNWGMMDSFWSRQIQSAKGFRRLYPNVKKAYDKKQRKQQYS